ncbi:MAG: hypothetical protein M1831_007294 [Alyxoria varia]|nr:MAG: hypothetical protein M1831_007294 [Alyxoria varia]
MISFCRTICWTAFLAIVVLGANDDSDDSFTIGLPAPVPDEDNEPHVSQFVATTTTFGEYGEVDFNEADGWFPDFIWDLLGSCENGGEYVRPITKLHDPFQYALPALKMKEDPNDFVLVRAYAKIEEGVRRDSLAGFFRRWMHLDYRKPPNSPREEGTLINQPWRGERDFWGRGQEAPPKEDESAQPASFSIRVEGVRRARFQEEQEQAEERKRVWYGGAPKNQKTKDTCGRGHDQTRTAMKDGWIEQCLN